MNTQILIRYGYIPVPETIEDSPIGQQQVATILSNLAYYGYTVTAKTLSSLYHAADILGWYADVKAALETITGDDLDIGSFVVYKNFPQEVLAMSDAEYWIKQFLIYFGVDSKILSQEEEERGLLDFYNLRVLLPAEDDVESAIWRSLANNPSRWTYQQALDAIETMPNSVDLSQIVFKENMAIIASLSDNPRFTSPTDLLRWVAGTFSEEGDTSLRKNPKFIRISRADRRKILFALQDLPSYRQLEESFAMRPEVWKRLMKMLHPFEYIKNAHLCNLIKRLYSGNCAPTFNSLIERGIKDVDFEVLSLLESRPGVYMRRLVEVLKVFGDYAVTSFLSVANKLTVKQLVYLKRLLEFQPFSEYRAFTPKGSWEKVQIVEGDDLSAISEQIEDVIVGLREAIKIKVNNSFPNGVFVPSVDDLYRIALPSNESELTPYGRGTSFPIPEGITTVRSTSFWQHISKRVVWYDTGWTFLGADFKEKGTCDWLNPKLGIGAVFAGDPVNISNTDNKAAQMIDLNLEVLKSYGIRYCIWSLLCYSRVPFSDAEVVLGSLAFSKNPQQSKLYEPSEQQITFKINSDRYNRYICYLDLHTMNVVYMDVSFKVGTANCQSNSGKIASVFPAFKEYLDRQPRLGDVFESVYSTEGGTPILYSDENFTIDVGDAYVFAPANTDNQFTQANINEVLSM